MPQDQEVVIVGADGTEHVFPSGFDPKKAAAIVSGGNGDSRLSTSLGLNTPDTSPLSGLLKGAASGAVDLGQGALSKLTDMFAVNETPQLDPTPPAKIPAPDNLSGKVGALLPDAAMIAIPGIAAVDAIPSATRAGQTFQKVMGAAKDVPLDLSKTGDAALRIQQLAERGGTMPKVVRNFLTRVTDPAQAGMNYGEGRDFASNISRLSANEYGRLTPVVSREVAAMSEALNTALKNAAGTVGHAEDYAGAMKEYAQAMKMKQIVSSLLEGAKKTVPYATAAGGGAWIAKALSDAMK